MFTTVGSNAETKMAAMIQNITKCVRLCVKLNSVLRVQRESKWHYNVRRAQHRKSMHLHKQVGATDRLIHENGGGYSKQMQTCVK